MLSKHKMSSSQNDTKLVKYAIIHLNGRISPLVSKPLVIFPRKRFFRLYALKPTFTFLYINYKCSFLRELKIIKLQNTSKHTFPPPPKKNSQINAVCWPGFRARFERRTMSALSLRFRPLVVTAALFWDPAYRRRSEQRHFNKKEGILHFVLYKDDI